MTLTVRALKEMIQSWPEVDMDGEPTEVWVQTSQGLSSEATEVWPLNKKVNDEGFVTYDMLISTLND